MSTNNKNIEAQPKKENGPSMALSMIFAGLMTLLVIALAGFVGSVTLGSQWGVELFTSVMKWTFMIVGAVMAYGFAVGVYHTFLSATGLDRGRQKVS